MLRFPNSVPGTASLMTSMLMVVAGRAEFRLNAKGNELSLLAAPKSGVRGDPRTRQKVLSGRLLVRVTRSASFHYS